MEIRYVGVLTDPVKYSNLGIEIQKEDAKLYTEYIEFAMSEAGSQLITKERISLLWQMTNNQISHDLKKV